jgi:hypothetical protein
MSLLAIATAAGPMIDDPDEAVSRYAHAQERGDAALRSSTAERGRNRPRYRFGEGLITKARETLQKLAEVDVGLVPKPSADFRSYLA